MRQTIPGIQKRARDRSDRELAPLCRYGEIGWRRCSSRTRRGSFRGVYSSYHPLGDPELERAIEALLSEPDPG
jgi:hypothetical protein